MTPHEELTDRLRCFDRVSCNEAADLIESQAREIAALKEQVEGFRKVIAPFAAYEQVRSTMGGCTPKEGLLWAVEARAGRAEITVEDMQAAVAAIAAKWGSDG